MISRVLCELLILLSGSPGFSVDSLPCRRNNRRRKLERMSENLMKLTKSWVIIVLLGLSLVTHRTVAELSPRPNPSNTAELARWLVGSNSWGVLSTISLHLAGSPWGNVASFSDGPAGNGTGTPYFYLTALDPTPMDLEKNPNCSLTLSETPLGTCGSIDPEDPTCAKITLSGQMVQITNTKDPEYVFAKNAIFTKHPEMTEWPADHNWRIYKLIIANIFLVDNFGGAALVTVPEYFNPKNTVSS